MRSMARKLRILTWHVHGNYLYYLTQVPHEFWLVTDAVRSPHHAGRSGSLPWGENVHEAYVERIREMQFDVVLFQSRDAWEREQHELLTPAQRALPRIYLEHDPPQQHPTNTRHWAADDAGLLLVHVTPVNALLGDSGASAMRVIEHGVVPLAPDRYRGELERGLVVVNNIERRGRRLGLDVFEQVRGAVPLELVGMGAEALGGREVANHLLPGVMASHRFFFNPIRYTSLGLAIIEAMMVGMPIVGLATTELVTVIRSGENGHVDTRIDSLVEAMRRLLHDPGEARRLGDAARRTALERFGIERFVADWLDALRSVTQ
jgi:hypothetical protein